MNQRRLRAASLVISVLLAAGQGIAACTPLHFKTRKGIYHTVGRDETLWRICHAYGVNMQSVCRFNKIQNPESIHPGQRIFIPSADAVRRPAPAKGKRITFRKPTESRARKKTPARKPPGTPPGKVPGRKPKESVATLNFIWPVKGPVTSWFGIRKGRRHDGIDIAESKGTPIHAAERGKVIYSDDGIRGFGNLIIIKHRGGFRTVYAHNSRNKVEVEETVKKGQVIGYVGSTGLSTGNHLHFEVRKGAKAVDPMKYLP